MPKLNSTSTPAYRLHKGRGLGVVTLNGRDHYLGKFGSPESKAAYDRLISEWLNAGRQLPDATQGLTVAELALAYWRAVGQQLKGGRADNLRAILKLLRETYGSVPLTSFGPKAFKVLRDKMREKGWSRSFINQQGSWIKRMFRWGATEELVSGDQVHSLWSVSGIRRGTEGYRETPPVRPVAIETVQATLPFLPPMVATMVQIQLLSGARPAEICKLQVADLDMTMADLWTCHPEKHKTTHLGKQRIIYFGPKCIELLRPWLRADGKCIFSPAESEERRNQLKREGRATPMTPSQAARRRMRDRSRPWGEHYTTGNYRNAIVRACLKAKVEPWAPNRLRHTRASEVRKGFGLEAAQVFLGHSHAAITEVYAERDARLGQQVARQIG
jgi:integrase